MGSPTSNGLVAIKSNGHHANGYATVSNGSAKRQCPPLNGKITTPAISYVPPPAQSSPPTPTAAAAIKDIGNRDLFEEPPWHISLSCYLSYAVLNAFGHLRDFLRYTGLEKNKTAVERDREGYAPLYKNYESFYTRNIYRRIRDVWNRPIASVPGVHIDLLDRVSHDYNWTFE